MNLKKLMCSALGASMLLSTIYIPATYAWGVYDVTYGTEEYEQSKTTVTDDMEQLRQNDTLESLIYTVRADGSAMITGFSARFWQDTDPNFSVELNIPSEIDGHPVTAIGNNALRDGATKISGITLPSTIKEIGNNAIYGRYLKYLKLNDGLEVIKDYAIGCGDVLETLVVPESVKYIGSGGIRGEALKNITLPKNLEYLGENILMGTAYAYDPESRERENDILYHGQYLISATEGIMDEPRADDPQDLIVNGKVYRERKAVGDIEIREGTALMGTQSFAGTEITSVKFPSTLKSIPYASFYWCEKLNNVVIPGNIKEIGPSAFSGCENLSNLTIEEGVELIGSGAFYFCNNLNEVTIPKSVKQIDMHAFGWDYADDYDVRNENLVIKAYSGSAGEKYARDNGFKCILLDTGEVIEKGDPTAAADARGVCEEKGEKCAVKRFRDLQSAGVDSNHYGIEYCLDNGIMAGTGADTFNPNDSITRAQFATMFYRFAGSPETSDNSGFADLTQDWYKKPIAWAAANEILNGTGNNMFSPNEVITREQIAAIFYRYAKTKGIDVSFGEDINVSYDDYNDSGEIADYALIPMSWCFSRSIMHPAELTGYYGIFPKAAPTRADTAMMFLKFSYVFE